MLFRFLRVLRRQYFRGEPEYARATQLYTRRGFSAEEHPALTGATWRTLVFSLGLDGHAPVPWSAVLDRGELCGRELPVAAAAAA